MTGNTMATKTAISLPDDLFRAVDARARALKLSRSGLLARAAREFLEKASGPEDATEAWNRAIARGGQPGDDPGARAFRARTKAIVRKAKRSER
jgi:predicted transcriptional regulator